MVDPDSFDSDEISAMVALLARVAKAQRIRETHKKIAEEAQAKVGQAGETAAKTISAFAIFGFDQKGAALWEAVRDVIGSDRWNTAIQRGQDAAADALRTEYKIPETPPIENQSYTRSLATSENVSSSPSLMTEKTRPSIKEIVLAHLRSSADRGAKASDIRELMAMMYDLEVHEKTVGMTLYRLSQQGLVRREGRIWFFVPQSAETENPGGDTPGQTSIDFEEERKVDDV